MVIFILTKFGTDLVIFVDARVEIKSNSTNFPNSRANNSKYSRTIIPIIELIRDLMVIYIVTKFDAGWFIFADARV